MLYRPHHFLPARDEKKTLCTFFLKSCQFKLWPAQTPAGSLRLCTMVRKGGNIYFMSSTWRYINSQIVSEDLILIAWRKIDSNHLARIFVFPFSNANIYHSTCSLNPSLFEYISIHPKFELIDLSLFHALTRASSHQSPPPILVRAADSPSRPQPMGLSY